MESIRTWAVTLSGEAAVTETGSMSQLGGLDPQVLLTSVNWSFHFPDTVPFLLEDTCSTMVAAWAGFPQQLQDASGATSSPPTFSPGSR